MNHLKWMGHSATIFDIQKNLRTELDSCEVTLVAKGYMVRAHRFVLSSCSDMMRNLLSDIPRGQEASIIVPDIKGILLDSVMEFVYMGETSLTSNNLSEFLEAINILGIKSAISFECNPAPMTTTTTMPVKTINEIQMGPEELIEQDKLEPQNVIADQQPGSTRDLGFIDVYNEAQHKITYSIEHMPGTTNANEFILTENSGTYTLTQNTKMENASHSDSEKIGDIEEDEEDDVADSAIIEEYSSGPEPIIEISDHSANANVCTNAITVATNPTVIQIKPKIKTIKMKSNVNVTTQHQHQHQQHQHQQHHHQHQEDQEQEQLNEDIEHSEEMDACVMDTSDEPISVLKLENYSLSEGRTGADAALELAVQAVIDEGMSLQKAAQKYDLSKTVLWRRVRKHPNYMKTARCNPILNMAHERLKNGDSLKVISRDLDIPMSTLHRYKVRLAQQGRLPDYVTFKKRDANSKDALKLKLAKAVHACVHAGMSQNHAANLFDIPKSTLWRHLQKRVAEAELQNAEGDGESETETIKEEVILS